MIGFRLWASGGLVGVALLSILLLMGGASSSFGGEIPALSKEKVSGVEPGGPVDLGGPIQPGGVPKSSKRKSKFP